MAIAAILTAEKVEEMLGRKTFSEKMEDVGGVCAVQSAVSNSMGGVGVPNTGGLSSKMGLGS